MCHSTDMHIRQLRRRATPHIWVHCKNLVRPRGSPAPRCPLTMGLVRVGSSKLRDTTTTRCTSRSRESVAEVGVRQADRYPTAYRQPIIRSDILMTTLFMNKNIFMNMSMNINFSRLFIFRILRLPDYSYSEYSVSQTIHDNDCIHE